MRQRYSLTAVGLKCYQDRGTSTCICTCTCIRDGTYNLDGKGGKEQNRMIAKIIMESEKDIQQGVHYFSHFRLNHARFAVEQCVRQRG